jgi:transcriptional regulator with XRE-family HTH domain
MGKEASSDRPHFAVMVKEARGRHRLSQRQLGERIGVWNTYVGQIEKGEKVPSDEVCAKLAEVLDLDATVVMLAAYEAKADSDAAKALFRRIKSLLADPVIQQILNEGRPLDAQLLVALEEEDLRAALKDAGWRELLGRCYRMRRRRNIPGLLAVVEAMTDKQWKAMVNMLEAMGLEAPE